MTNLTAFSLGANVVSLAWVVIVVLAPGPGSDCTQADVSDEAVTTGAHGGGEGKSRIGVYPIGDSYVPVEIMPDGSLVARGDATTDPGLAVLDALRLAKEMGLEFKAGFTR